MDGNNQNNQYNQGQYGENQYYGNQPSMNQNNQFDQPGMNQNNQFGQPGMNQNNQFGQSGMNQYNQGQMYPNQPQMGYQGYQQPMNGYQWNRPTLTKKEYYKNNASSNAKGNIIGAAVLMYLSTVITFFLSFIHLGNTGAILDCILILALALCIHLLYSRIAAVGALVYGIVNTITVTIAMGTFGGYWLLIAGVCACIGVFKLEKEYQQTIGGRY